MYVHKEKKEKEEEEEDELHTEDKSRMSRETTRIRSTASLERKTKIIATK